MAGLACDDSIRPVSNVFGFGSLANDFDSEYCRCDECGSCDVAVTRIFKTDCVGLVSADCSVASLQSSAVPNLLHCSN